MISWKYGFMPSQAAVAETHHHSTDVLDMHCLHWEEEGRKRPHIPVAPIALMARPQDVPDMHCLH